MDEQLMSPDLLSDLPLGIIHIILSFVPIRDAIQTSLLSRQWRYVWASLPHLTFDKKCVNPPMETESDEFEQRLIRFISQALLLHKGPIHKFQLRVPPMAESQLIDQWLLLLSRNDIRSLLLLEYEYDEDNASWFDVPPNLYSCQNLTHLQLHVNTIAPPPPSFKGFLLLRSLDIDAAEEDSSTIESIVAHSPLLENLTLHNYAPLDITIRAPNLKYFHLKFLCRRLSLCTPLLEELIGYFSSLIKSFQESSVFCHLTLIKLTYNAKQGLPMFIHLIKGAPNLQQLEISSCSYYSKLDCVSLSNTESAPHLTFDRLKLIKLGYFGDSIAWIKLIKFLLARSPVLEKMICTPKPNLPDLKLMKVMAQLLKCHRVSSNAEIVIVDDRFSSSLQV